MRLAVLAFVLAACSHDYHVALAPLPPGASAAQRVQAFEHYRTKAEVEDVSRSCGRFGCTKQSRPMLVLASGDEIRHPEDLAPLLGPGTDSGQQLAAIRRTKARRAQWALVGWAGLLTGVVLASVGLARESVPLQVTGAAIALAVGGVGTIGVLWGDSRIRTQTARAFDAYDASLARTLDVCVEGLAVVACPPLGSVHNLQLPGSSLD